MNVPNIGQGSGSVVTLPRPQPDTEVQPGTTRENPGSAPNAVHEVTVKDDDDFAHVGWFDANGDGHIDSRSSTYGGDGTLLLPAHAVYLPTYSRSVARPVAAKAAPVAVDAKAAEPPKQAAPPANDAQTRQAVAAYARYGQTPSSASTDQTQT
jgi:hypothetical protein